jgi:pre-60S factor REI1
VQTHMRDKGHCKIPYSTEYDQLAIGDYYDFRSTYSDGEDDDESETTEDGNGGAKLGARREAKAVGPDGEELEEGDDADGWETDSSGSDLDEEESADGPTRKRSSKNSKAHTTPAYFDEYELHLPSGRAVGHRSLNKYYRQNLYNHPSEEERAEQLLIEAARGEDGVEPNSDNQVALIKNRRREMAGVSDEKKRLARKDEQRNRDLNMYRAKKTEYAYGKKLNNQKHFYYRDMNGG